MELTSRNPRVLTIIVQNLTIVLLFCFVGCAASSCVGYGHSCWGAHGKRSDIQDPATLRILAAKSLLSGSSRNGIASSSVAQWLLTRLNSGQPVLPSTDKYRVRWSGFPKHRSYVPLKWEHGATPTDDENVEVIRIPINNESEIDERKVSNEERTMRAANGKLKNREILLVSPDDYGKPINGLRKLDLLKFLSKGNENTK